jgi:hypothetical protein
MICIKKFFFLSCMFLLMAIIWHSETAYAASWQDGLKDGGGEDITGQLETYVVDTASTSRAVAYGAGGLGAIALGALAFFGRFQWGWFFGLVGGLVMITLYNVGVKSIAGDGESPFQ